MPCQLPRKGEPSKQPTRGLQKAKSCLPLWGRWTRVSEDGEGSPPEACRRPSLASPFGGGGLALARTERAAHQRLAEDQVLPPPLGEVPPQGAEKGSPPEACRRPSLASPFGGGGLALARTERAARQRLAEDQVSPPPLGGAGAQWAPFSAWSPLPRRSVMDVSPLGRQHPSRQARVPPQEAERAARQRPLPKTIPVCLDLPPGRAV